MNANSASLGFSRSKVRLLRVSLDGQNSKGEKRFCFTVESLGTQRQRYHFFLSEHKALLLANHSGAFPIHVEMEISGRLSRKTGFLNHVKIHMIDGQEARAWAERHRSPSIEPSVLDESNMLRSRMDEMDKLMRNRSPGDILPPTFRSREEAFEGAMAILARKIRLKEPSLSKVELNALKDALNMLHESQENIIPQSRIEEKFFNNKYGKYGEHTKYGRSR